jgi:hypothetical protein
MKKYLTLNIVDEEVVALYTRMDHAIGFRLLGEYGYWETKCVKCEFFPESNTFIIKYIEPFHIKIVLTEQEIEYKKKRIAERVVAKIKNSEAFDTRFDTVTLRDGTKVHVHKNPIFDLPKNSKL